MNNMEKGMGKADGNRKPTTNSFIKTGGKAKGGDKNPLLKPENRPMSKRK